MNIEVAFNEFPALQSENLILKKIEASNIEELYTIYSNERYLNIVELYQRRILKL